ncbi:MAG: hypothetical protein CMH98_11175 [Oceanospirillaceae bacterium]|nr:hypothetical protein [Oceanospirillaceae bacterium]
MSKKQGVCPGCNTTLGGDGGCHYPYCADPKDPGVVKLKVSRKWISLEQIEIAAKALWDSQPHKMLEAGGYPVDWESQPSIIKKGERRKVGVILKSLALEIEGPKVTKH